MLFKIGSQSMRFFILFLFLIFPKLSHSEVFKVLLPVLPSLNPITNQVNSGVYIGSNLYYPLFEIDSGTDKISSFFLDLNMSKSTSNRFDEYMLCLKNNLVFDDGTSITIHDLSASVQKFSTMYPHILKINKFEIINTVCLKLKLKAPAPGLFKKLTGIASTILKESTIESEFPVGIGPYMLQEKTSDFIKLKFRDQKISKPRFETIYFEKYSINTKNISTFNDINQMPPVNGISKKGKTITAPNYKVYVNVLNFRDRKKRIYLHKIISEIDWVKIFKLNLTKSFTFLPIKYGSINEFLTPNKALTVQLNKIPLLVPDIYNTELLAAEFKHKKIDKLFQIHKIPTRSFVNWVFSGKEYVAMMAFDSSGSISSLEGDFSVYLESFCSENNRIVSKPIKFISDILNKSNGKILKTERIQLMKDADLHLIKEGYVAPIGHVSKEFIFDENIEIKEWFDYFSGIPKIYRIE